jgi:hypothetical protein
VFGSSAEEHIALFHYYPAFPFLFSRFWIQVPPLILSILSSFLLNVGPKKHKEQGRKEVNSGSTVRKRGY